MAKGINERELVLDILMEITEEGQYSHIILRDVLEKYQYLEKKERAFITRLTEGTLEHMLEMDYILDQYSKVKVRKMKPVIRNILRMSVYQLLYMDSVPDRAVCNEAVRLASRRGFSGLKGFVNGVLRTIAREADKIHYPEDPEERLSVQYSIPAWMIKMWEQTYDMETIEKILKAFQEERPLTIRCNTTKVTPEELEEHLQNEGVNVRRHPYLPYAFSISGYNYLKSLESFQNGEFSVQDISSMLVAEIAAPAPGDFVIDVCAAPGGKSMHMAELLNGTGQVEARDLTEAKVELIRENILRSGLDNITAVQQDALIPDESSREKADVVIADLPCSGLGILGRKNDLKYKASQEGIHSLAKLQRDILSTVQAYVKPGGRLVYSTCTVSLEENEENVDWFFEEVSGVCSGRDQ